ncbi:MAG: MoxR family ATPase [Planctomycetes bacterium]|nr:MoxR family ATPase [Planctomycetota bacterium]
MATESLTKLRANLEQGLLGKPDAVRLGIIALLARGHILIEDVPGVGKTTFARTLARSIACPFKRIQFTPDLLPADITGFSLYDADRKEFVFRPGPIFASIVLADEINRSTPRTQSALLEAMNDAQVTVDGTSRPLPSPFLVLATQNPFEYAGTYPLPESQLDRFLLKLQIGYPDAEAERRIYATRGPGLDGIDALPPVLSATEVSALCEAVPKVKVDPAISSYILDLVSRTRDDRSLVAGVSPRGGVALYRAAQASAFLAGRTYVTPDDVKGLAVAVFGHRVIPRARRSGEGADAGAAIMARLLDEVACPA